MKKDQADEFERELMRPLAQALRTRLGEAGEVHVNNEPRLMTGDQGEPVTRWAVARAAREKPPTPTSMIHTPAPASAQP